MRKASTTSSILSPKHFQHLTPKCSPSFFLNVFHDWFSTSCPVFYGFSNGPPPTFPNFTLTHTSQQTLIWLIPQFPLTYTTNFPSKQVELTIRPLFYTPELLVPENIATILSIHRGIQPTPKPSHTKIEKEKPCRACAPPNKIVSLRSKIAPLCWTYSTPMLETWHPYARKGSKQTSFWATMEILWANTAKTFIQAVKMIVSRYVRNMSQQSLHPLQIHLAPLQRKPFKPCAFVRYTFVRHTSMRHTLHPHKASFYP